MITQDIINPLLQPWLDQVQGAEMHRIHNLALAEFGLLIRGTWTYSGHQADVWTHEHI